MQPAALPKVELHCHLDGLIDPLMLRELRRQGIALPVTPEMLEAAYPVESMDDFWRWGRVARPLEGDLERFKPVLAVHLARLKAQRVRYTELMIASSEVPRDPVKAVETMRAFREWVDGQEGGAIQVEFLRAFNRARTPEAVAALADEIIALHEAGLIVGVALAGPEQGFPVRPLEKTFARFCQAGLGIEIHAGEWCGPESVWDALEYGYPDRIGHGVSLFRDPRLVEVVRERGIHIEMCPTANLRFSSVARLEDHPIATARALGLSFSVNTDDPGATGATMASEYDLLASLFGFGEEDFARLYANSLAARFQPALRVAV